MAQYRATIQGQRQSVSRLGGKSSGITARINGWHLGVAVNGRYDEKTDCDVFDVDVTGGSAGGNNRDFIVTERRTPEGLLLGFTVSEKPAEVPDGA